MSQRYSYPPLTAGYFICGNRYLSLLRRKVAEVSSACNILLQPTSVSAAVTTSLVKHVSYVSTAKNEPGYDIYADKVQQSFYRTGCMLDKECLRRAIKPTERWITLNKSHSGHYSIGMIAAVLIGLSAVCPFASIHAAPSVAQSNNLNSVSLYNESSWVPPLNFTSPVTSSPGDVSASFPTEEQGVPADVKQAANNTVQSLSSQPPLPRGKMLSLAIIRSDLEPIVGLFK